MQLDPDILNFFLVCMAVAVSGAVGGGLFVLITRVARRIGRSSQTPPDDVLEDLSARLEVLEAKASQSEDLEERVDFMERVLLALRDGKVAPQGLPPRKKTPV